MNPWIAAAMAFGLAAAGYAAGWLTPGGAVAAGAVGTAVFGGAGFSGALVLALFFVSGSLLSAWNARRYGDRRGARRNHRQVLANGTWAAIGAVLVPRDLDQGWAVLAGALAAAQSDTWATEIGRHSPSPPRLITTGQPVAHGASGGVTWLGTAGGLAGAATLAGVATLAGAPVRVATFALIGGVLGLFADSLLGATVQGDEAPARGLRWFDNDVVNFAATAAGSLTALAGTRWL